MADSDEKRKAGSAAPADSSGESVDDILAGIMDNNGSFNDEFNGLFARYLGSNAQQLASIMDVDLSDRTDESRLRGRIEYEAVEEKPAPQPKSVDRRIEERLPDGMREIYSAAAGEAQRPEFTSAGSVKYPTMGVGASEERVVFDAEWEERAQKEAAQRERQLQDRMLRGDSTYVRSFVSGGMPMSTRASTVPSRPQINNSYIDPLSDDDELDGIMAASLHRSGKRVSAEDIIDEVNSQNSKKPFFQEGFSAVRNSAASGKTVNGISAAAAPTAAASASIVPPQVKASVDSAVLDAFSQSFDSEQAFKERWKSTVDEAQNKRNEREEMRRKQQEAALRAAERAEKQRLAAEQARIAEDEMKEEKKRSLEVNGVPISSEDMENLARIAQENVDIKSASASPSDSAAPFGEQKQQSPGERVKAAADDSFYSEKAPAQMSTGRMSEQLSATAGDKKISKGSENGSEKKGLKNFLHNNFPAKGDTTKERVRKIVLDAACLCLVVSAVYLSIYFHNYKAKINQTSEFENLMSEYEDYDPNEIEAAWENIKTRYPDVVFPEGMQLKFAPLYAISQNFVGWLKINNTNISTALLQSDYNGYYLYKDIYGQYSRYGNPYVDSRADMTKTGLSKNTIIYGHNTHDGLMFAQLTNYMTLDGYKKAPVVTLDTLYGTSKWKIFAVMLTNSTPETNNGYVFQYLYTDFSSEASFMSLVNDIYDRSMIHTGVDVQASDKILTLYTCYQNIFTEGRLVVFARQVRDGEMDTVDVSKAYYDNSAIFPQAYYDKMNTANPYAQAQTPTQNSSTTETVPEVSTEGVSAAQETTSEEAQVSGSTENTSAQTE